MKTRKVTKSFDPVYMNRGCVFDFFVPSSLDNWLNEFRTAKVQ